MIPTMIFFFVVGLTTIASGAGSPTATIDHCNEHHKTVVDSSNKFSYKLYTNLKSSNEDSFVYSPFSVHMLLAMVTYGTAGRTKSQLQTALELPRDDAMAQDGFGLIVRDMNSYENVKLMVKNKIFASTSLEIENEYKCLIEDTFKTPTGRVDFTHVDQAVKNINGWCATNTRGLIKEIVPSPNLARFECSIGSALSPNVYFLPLEDIELKPDDLDEKTMLVLANVVYFKGGWKTPFYKLTMKRPFYKRNGNVERVKMMTITADFKYGNILNGIAEFVELPYQSNDPEYGVSMFIILPTKNHTIDEVEQQITQITIDNLIDAGSISTTEVHLPKFRIESDIKLNGPLKDLGITDMFDHEVANFSGITGSEDLAVKTVKQKAVVEVSQTGTKAAAASVAKFFYRMYNHNKMFMANHPFIAIIATTGTKRVNLFTARYNGP